MEGLTTCQSGVERADSRGCCSQTAGLYCGGSCSLCMIRAWSHTNGSFAWCLTSSLHISTNFSVLMLFPPDDSHLLLQKLVIHVAVDIYLVFFGNCSERNSCFAPFRNHFAIFRESGWGGWVGWTHPFWSRYIPKPFFTWNRSGKTV